MRLIVCNTKHAVAAGLMLLFACVAIAQPPQTYLSDTVRFRFDSHSLLPTETERLPNMVDLFKTKPYYVEVTGHTDAVGSDAYNQALSNERAKAVAMYLISLGLTPDRVGFKGLGTQVPLGDNATVEGRRRNRRAEVDALFVGSLPANASATQRDSLQKLQDVIKRKIDSLEAVLRNEKMAKARKDSIAKANRVDTIFASRDQYAVMSPDTNTLVISPDGTQFYIPKGTFKTNQRQINVRVSELYSRKAIIGNEVTTLSNTSPTETFGMVRIEATYDNTPIATRPDSAVRVRIPFPKADPRLRTYLAQPASGKRERPWADRKWKDKVFTPTPINVKTWQPAEMKMEYNPAENAYEIRTNSVGNWINLARPLVSRDTAKKTTPTNVIVKVKGKVFANASIFITSKNEAPAYIYLRSDGGKTFSEQGIEGLEQFNRMAVIGVQYEPRSKTLYFSSAEYDLAKVRKTPKDKVPTVKLTAKFRKITLEEYFTRISEL